MNKEIEILIQKNILRDIELKMLDRELEGMIISKEVMQEILKEIEDNLK
jgi:hypothetical protein